MVLVAVGRSPNGKKIAANQAGVAVTERGCIVGSDAGNMFSDFALAIEMGADAVDIVKTIHPHPTLGESIGMAAEAFEGVCTDLPPARKKLITAHRKKGDHSGS